MGIGTSILLITVGAIMFYAVNEREIGPLEIDTVGKILMLVGILGLVLSLVYTFVLSGRRDRTVVEHDPPRDRMGPRY